MAKDFPGDKAAPEETAEGTLKSIEAGEEDIFIDDFAKQFQNDYESNPLGLAKQFAEMLPQPVS
ncbi:MAG: hypothetical protein ACQ9MH_14095 [Nitrospinales bacterium]